MDGLYDLRGDRLVWRAILHGPHLLSDAHLVGSSPMLGLLSPSDESTQAAERERDLIPCSSALRRDVHHTPELNSALQRLFASGPIWRLGIPNMRRCCVGGRSFAPIRHPQNACQQL